jgi:hypothetical protein
VFDSLIINAREYGRGKEKFTIHRIWQQRARKKNKKNHDTICVGHPYGQANTTNLNKTRALLQTARGKDEPTLILLKHKYNVVHQYLKTNYQPIYTWVIASS